MSGIITIIFSILLSISPFDFDGKGGKPRFNNDKEKTEIIDDLTGG